MSMGFSVMEDFASVPLPVSSSSPFLPLAFTMPNGTSRASHASPSASCRCSARVSPPGVRTVSHPTTLAWPQRSEEHTSELQSQSNLVCRLLLEKKKKIKQSQLLVDNVVRE